MTGIDIRLLRAFVTLADKGSYQKAADVLFLTQPALSKQIKGLEALMGGALFLRGRHGAQLTSTGQHLYLKAQELLKHHLEFVSFAQDIHKENTGKLLLGFGISSFQNVPVWINIFRRRFPKSEVNISQINSGLQVKMLQEGQLHVGFLRLPVPRSLSYHVLSEETLVLALPSKVNYSANNIQEILLAYPLLQIDPAVSPCLASQTSNFLKNNDLSAEIISATQDIPSLLALIAGDNGCALLPSSISNILPAGVKLITPGINQRCWHIGMAWNPGIPNNRRDDFLQIIRDNAMLP